MGALAEAIEVVADEAVTAFSTDWTWSACTGGIEVGLARGGGTAGTVPLIGGYPADDAAAVACPLAVPMPTRASTPVAAARRMFLIIKL